jgi:rRNA maturation endonuclease Nob1
MNTPQTPKSNVSILRTRGARTGVGDKNGIVVQEEQLTSIRAQLLYRMRCECGRPWFEVELPKLVACPSCGKRGVVVL